MGRFKTNIIKIQFKIQNKLYNMAIKKDSNIIVRFYFSINDCLNFYVKLLNFFLIYI